MQHYLYPDNWKQRVVEANLRVSRKGNLYFLPLHTCHVNHDPENPQAQLQKLCPRCHGKTHPWLRGKRDRRKPHRYGYQTVSVTQLIQAVRVAGLLLEPGEEGYAWRIADLVGTAPDVLDAISQALHCLRRDDEEQQEDHHHG